MPINKNNKAPLAQLVEQKALNFKVGGSNPSRGIMNWCEVKILMGALGG